MKYVFPILFLLLIFSCKKDENQSVHEPVAGLEAISSKSQIDNAVVQGVSMVFFHASWCEVCQAQRPAVTEVATDSELSSVYFGEVEYDDHPDIIEAYGIVGFPTIVIFKDGAEVMRYTGGGNTAQTLKQEILTHL